MSKITAWLKKWWWTIALGAAAILGFVARGLFMGGAARRKVDAPDFTANARRRIDEAEAKYLQRKAEAKAEGGVKRKELSDIKQIEDPRERRSKLAAWLRENT
jgi:hypothetical protein